MEAHFRAAILLTYSGCMRLKLAESIFRDRLLQASIQSQIISERFVTMASHLSVIGIRSHDEFVHYMKALLGSDSCTAYSEGLEQPSYRLPANEAAVWVHTSNSCFVPTHQSPHSNRIRIVEWLPDTQHHCPFCSLLAVEILSESAAVRYPLALAVGNCIKAQKELQPGDELSLNITAFVESGQVWPDLATYNEQESDPDMPIAIGPGWFFPGGPYSALETGRQFSPSASFFGIIENTALHTNPVSGNRYRTASVRCGDILYFAVMDPQEFEKLEPGNVVYLNTWMCFGN